MHYLVTADSQNHTLQLRSASGSICVAMSWFPTKKKQKESFTRVFENGQIWLATVATQTITLISKSDT